MSRLWIPRGGELRDAAIEQSLLMHDVDFWRMWRRTGMANGLSPQSPTDFLNLPSGCHDLYDCDTSNQYTLTVSGITSGSSCASPHNRTWTLSYVGTELRSGVTWIQWEEVITVSCTVGTTSVDRLRCRLETPDNISCRAVLSFTRRATATGIYASTSSYITGVTPSFTDDFQCGGSTVLNRLTALEFSGWPTTYTVSKV